VALCPLEGVTKEKRPSPETPTKPQNRLTAKDLSASEGQAGTKSTKPSQDKALGPTCKPGDIEVHRKPGLYSCLKWPSLLWIVTVILDCTMIGLAGMLLFEEIG
jgi:hypothetical protein